MVRKKLTTFKPNSTSFFHPIQTRFFFSFCVQLMNVPYELSKFAQTLNSFFFYVIPSSERLAVGI